MEKRKKSKIQNAPKCGNGIGILVVGLLLLPTFYGNAQHTNKLLFFNTDWGRTDSWDVFCERTKSAGYDGLETWLPQNQKEQKELKAALEKHGLLVGFLNGTNRVLPFQESLARYREHLTKLIAWEPSYINCHTGSDFFTFEQNKAFIEIAITASKESGIPIYHETHRGRFSYNLPDTKKYLSAVPELQLTLDISHWMVVHESLLEGQGENLELVLERTGHIHARVGHAEGPQVNDPEAPEWKKALERHLDIWENTIHKKRENKRACTITTEFGPPDYMPTLPYNRMPVSDQWKANVFMMNALKKRIGAH
ncbi:MAG: TIM barrel protein [Bacteroidota bacterium]